MARSGGLSPFLGAAASFLFAAGLHLGAFVFLAGDQRQHGLIESEVASVSMNLLETKVLEDVIQGDSENLRASDIDQAPSAAATAEQQPDDPPREPVPEPEIRPEVKKLPEKAPNSAAVEEPPAPLETPPRIETVKETPRVLPEKTAGEPKQKKTQKSKKQESQEASRRSAAVKRGSLRGQAKGPRAQSTGRREASLGSVRAYAGLVQARIARRQPSGGGKGTVVIGFGISVSGQLRFARISRSSGNRSLDMRALSAVRRAAPFPRPPKGMTSRQLTYSFPFRFR